jgi:hypothetical protein
MPTNQSEQTERSGAKKMRDGVAVGLSVLLLVGFALISFRGLLGPEAASTRFGMPAVDAAGILFYRVYLSRNLVIVASGLSFLVLGQKRALALLMTFAAFLPVFDGSILLSQLGGAAHLTIHIVSFVLLALAAAALWARALDARTAAT